MNLFNKSNNNFSTFAFVDMNEPVRAASTGQLRNRSMRIDPHKIDSLEKNLGDKPLLAPLSNLSHLAQGTTYMERLPKDQKIKAAKGFQRFMTLDQLKTTVMDQADLARQAASGIIPPSMISDIAADIKQDTQDGIRNADWVAKRLVPEYASQIDKNQLLARVRKGTL